MDDYAIAREGLADTLEALAQRRWHPEMGGSPMPPTSAERYEQIARDLNLCGCEWCEGHARGADDGRA